MYHIYSGITFKTPGPFSADHFQIDLQFILPFLHPAEAARRDENDFTNIFRNDFRLPQAFDRDTIQFTVMADGPIAALSGVGDRNNSICQAKRNIRAPVGDNE